jgi:PAT family beta-lactamase induction signal transducer AmpG
MTPLSGNGVEPPKTRTRMPPKKRIIGWVCTTYFAEGLPFMIVRILSGVFFTQIGVKERYLGYLNFLGLPWNIKFLWAPLVDGWGTKRGWQVALQALLGALTAAVALLAHFAGGAAEPAHFFEAIAGVFVLMAIVAATNDIAIDGYYLEALPKREDQALYSGYRVLAYRMAMVFARSGLVAFAAWSVGTVTSGSVYDGWCLAFGVGAITLIGGAFLHSTLLPHSTIVHTQVETQFAKARRVFVEGFKTYIAQPQVLITLIFIVLYKMGDELLFSMVTPFMLRELRVSAEQYATIGGIVGALGTIVGAMWGGWLIQKMGLKKALWPLTIAMNANIWLYIWLSIAKPNPLTTKGLSVIALIHGIEQIAAGLGSAALLVFLLGTCSREYRATHYAIGSAIMSIPGTIVGGYGGVIVEGIGYTGLYLMAFVASLPGMLLIPFVPIREE